MVMPFGRLNILLVFFGLLYIFIPQSVYMKNIAYLSLILFSLKSTAQTIIYPYSDGHRWGLTNANLEVIARPQFDTTVFFDKESYAIAIKDKRYGAIGRDGKTLTGFTYDKLYVQAEGFGRGYTKANGYTREGYQKFVLLDLRTGKVVSQEPYDQIWHYCHCADKIFIIQKDTQTIFISGITGKQLGKGIYQGIA